MLFRSSARFFAALVAVLAVPVNAHAEERPLDQLVALVVERLDTADAVAAAKWVAAAERGSQLVIDDPGREAQVYDAMALLGSERGLPETWVRQVFSGQIEANKIVQRGLVSWWRFDASTVPSTPPDLAAVRPIIDRVNAQIIDQLALRRSELAGPACTERLAPSVFAVLTAGRVDTMHKTALVRAAAALCAP